MKQTILSLKQSDLLENLVVNYGQIVTSDQIHAEAGKYFDYQHTKDMIARLVDNGWLIRLKRGLYAISDFASRGHLFLSPVVIANLIESDSYVSFEAALQQYRMFDQLTNKTISISLKQRKAFTLSGTEYAFVKTRPEYYFGWQELPVEQFSARVATPEKALIDMVNFHRSRYSIDLVIEKLFEHKADFDLARLNDYLARFSTTMIKIFGFLYDLIGINSDDLYELINPKAGTSWMIPGDRNFNAKWRLYYHEYFDKYKNR